MADGTVTPLLIADSDRLHWIAQFSGSLGHEWLGWHEIIPGEGNFMAITTEPGEGLVVEVKPVILTDETDVDVDDAGQAADRPAWPRRLLVRLGQLLGGG